MRIWLLCCFLCLCTLTLVACVKDSRSDPISWMKSIPGALGMEAARDTWTNFDPETDPWMEQVAVKPRVFYFHNFLSDAERAHIIEVAAPQLRRSQVSSASGQGVYDNIRTSYGMFIRRLQDPVIERIERRIADVTMLPLENQEDIQVLRYGINQTYGAHYDSSFNDANDKGPCNRIATFLMYLSDVEEGGETAFPHNSEWVDPSMAEKLGPWSTCAQGHVSAKPRKGDAVLFWSLKPDGTPDEAAMHTGCPIIRGIKYASPVWIHTAPFEPQTLHEKRDPVPDPGLCIDNHNMCTTWSASGECDRNPEFMVGDVGACRRACKACTPCAQGDYECINRNRQAGGYLKLDRAEMEWLGVHLEQYNTEL